MSLWSLRISRKYQPEYMPEHIRQSEGEYRKTEEAICIRLHSKEFPVGESSKNEIVRYKEDKCRNRVSKRIKQYDIYK